jgi:MSHA biogenesis protein MshI
VSRQINLYNAAFIPKRELLTGQNLAWATLAMLCLLLIGGGWAGISARQKAAEAAEAQTKQKQAQAVMELARQASAARKPGAALQAEVDQAQQLLAMRGEVLAVLASGLGTGQGGAGFGDYLAGLARQSREGLWLTGFSVAAGGSGMVLRGRTVDKGMLPEYVRRLNAEPAFAGKAFAGMQMDFRDTARADSGGAVPLAPSSAAGSAAAAGPRERYLEFQLLAESATGAANAAAEKKP